MLYIIRRRIAAALLTRCLRRLTLHHHFDILHALHICHCQDYMESTASNGGGGHLVGRFPFFAVSLMVSSSRCVSRKWPK